MAGLQGVDHSLSKSRVFKTFPSSSSSSSLVLLYSGVYLHGMDFWSNRLGDQSAHIPLMLIHHFIVSPVGALGLRSCSLCLVFLRDIEQRHCLRYVTLLALIRSRPRSIAVM